jgi:hypothetical protein
MRLHCQAGNVVTSLVVASLVARVPGEAFFTIFTNGLDC